MLLSLPHSFLITAVLIANEIPDAPEDAVAGKRTWVVRIKAVNAYKLYLLVSILAFFMLLTAVIIGFLPSISLIAIPCGLFLVIKAAVIMYSTPDDKLNLINASKLAISTHILTSVILILAILK